MLLWGLKLYIYIYYDARFDRSWRRWAHQPIEHLASLRAIPNLVVMRPADFMETLECWQIAMERNGPSMLVLTRQNVEQHRNYKENFLSLQKVVEGAVTRINLQLNASLGAYILHDYPAPDATIFASGSEVGLAMKIAELMPKIRGPLYQYHPLNYF